MELPNGRSLPGMLLLLAGATFLIGVMLSESIAPAYSMNSNAISDLGTIPESSLLFNSTLLITGALTLVGGILLSRLHDRKAITALFILAGTGAVGAGIFNLSTPGVHGLFALLAFVSFNLLAIACSGMAGQPMKALCIVLGIIGLVFVVVMFLGDSGSVEMFGPIGHGGTERMIVYPVMVWMLTFGGYLMGNSSRASSG